ncbi:MAG: tRNA (uridine(34)/cytosine(34)/5-carboxymethylaminomethyluridine(34)-2'-O)-methyltransferase TrmL [Woeseia sp.]
MEFTITRVFTLILYQPEIPPNTGNIIRLCANTGTKLHLVRPLGFELDEPRLKRAGLDYREFAEVETHDSLDDCLSRIAPRKLYALSTRGVTEHAAPEFQAGDAFLFGPETRGLPADILGSLPAEQRLRIPMREDSRSLNLSNAAAIVIYEAWRQLDFEAGR